MGKWQLGFRWARTRYSLLRNSSRSWCKQQRSGRCDPRQYGWEVSVSIGKALSDSGSGSNSGVLGAVQSCVDDGAKVISLSLGGGGYSSTTDNFYKDLYEKEDILFVAAAGNGGSSSKLYPASYPALMSVAAIDSNKNKAGFSHYNDQVEI